MAKALATQSNASVLHRRLPHSLLAGNPSKRILTALFGSLFLLAWAYEFDRSIRLYEFTSGLSSFEVWAGDYERRFTNTNRLLEFLLSLGFLLVASVLLNLFGRLNVLVSFVAISVIGTIVQATANTKAAFLAGTALDSISKAIIRLTVLVLISDSTSLRNRVLFNMLPHIPYYINSWYNIWLLYSTFKEGAILWRWGVGIFGFIDPLCALPLVYVLFRLNRKSEQARVEGPSQALHGPVQTIGQKLRSVDIVGLVLAISAAVLIATPLALTAYFGNYAPSDRADPHPWSASYMIAPLVVGVACIPAFVAWEAFRGKNALLPTSDLRNRGVWAALGVVFMANLTLGFSSFDQQRFSRLAFPDVAWYSLRTEYTTIAAENIEVVIGVLAGVLARYVRQIKYIIVTGALISIIGNGILIRFRGGYDVWHGYMGGRFMVGIATGLVYYPSLTSLQSHVSHKNLPSFTALFLIIGTVGYEISYPISIAITNRYAEDFYDGGIMEARKLIQIIAICLSVPLLGFALLLKDPHLPDAQIIPQDEEDELARDEQSPLQRTASRV